MTFAHVAGIPVEELLPMAPVAGVLWLAWRARFQAAKSMKRHCEPPRG